MKAEMKQEVKERPILFSGAMVNAILEGRKTQTRRVMKPEPNLSWMNTSSRMGGSYSGSDARPGYNERGECWYFWIPGAASGEWKCPYGKPGDRLWVREAFYCNDYRYPNAEPSELLEEMTYRADHEAPCRCEEPLDGHWKPSIHMPRWASRITLEITNVRVERLNAISWDDIVAEGISDTFLPGYDRTERTFNGFVLLRDRFVDLWNGINGKKHPLASNPFVWVVEFRRV